MNLPDIMQRLEQLPDELQKTGEELAGAKAVFNFMREMRKTVLANETIAVMRAMKSSEKIKPSIAKAEVIALTSKNYERQLKGIQEAEKLHGTLQSKYEAMRAAFDAARSLLAFEKEQLSRL